MNTARSSLLPPAPPRRTLATRILVSFTVTLLAFAITVGFTVSAQKQAAEDASQLSQGFVPVALALERLHAMQSTIASIVDAIPQPAEDTDPAPSLLESRELIKILTAERETLATKARIALETLRQLGGTDTRQFALSLTGGLDATLATLAGDSATMHALYAASDGGDREAMRTKLPPLKTLEHEGDKRLKVLVDHVDRSMEALSSAARERERRAVLELALLAALTLAVGVGVALHTRRLLRPLERVTQRAKAVARGDLTPEAAPEADDEIGEMAVAFEKMVSAVAKAQSRAVANERLAAIGKMAAHVTHEIRNPLSSIGLNIELLEEELASAAGAEAKSLLGSITREVQRLELLSEEYLRVARLPQPRMEAEDLAAKVREIVAFAKPEMDRAGLELVLDVADDVPTALFDEGQIRQALLNVLRNAREAMSDGGKIEVHVRAEGMSVVVAVEDRGGGIPEELRSRIFDPFFSTKGEGTGLGLAITRQIVEAHGGSIRCATREGGGTSFSLLLPIAPPRSSGASSIRPSPASTGT